MAIVKITTTHGAVPPSDQPALAEKLATLTYEAEGFAGNGIAPTICWSFFDEQPARAFATAAGEPDAPLYYIGVTALKGTMDMMAKQRLGGAITSALLEQEGSAETLMNLNRIWVRFVDVDDGDLIVGGRSTSLTSLKALVAGAA